MAATAHASRGARNVLILSYSSRAIAAEHCTELQRLARMTRKHDSLVDCLSQSLSEGLEFTQYHISTPPTPCNPLCPPPPNGVSEKTYCELHSLLVTTRTNGSSSSSAQVAIFAVEVQIYTTARLTTVFVSKADSTGFLSILDLPRQSRSVLQSVTSEFISWVVRNRHRPDRRLVLTLFARAQNQYLFPGSFDNGKKHVLDDRALVKWWCKTLDPVLRAYAPELSESQLASDKGNKTQTIRAKAHLIVPGHDSYETQSFFPPSHRADPPAQRRWTAFHPLRQIATNPAAPPRCLVPRFPDDPKSRFLYDLDEELADAPQLTQSTASKYDSPSKRGKGQWKSVKTLEEFWELMAFRQECSAGRLVGFIWIVFTPDSMLQSDEHESRERSSSPLPSSLKRKMSDDAGDSAAATTSKRHDRLMLLAKRRQKAKKRLKGPIHPRLPRVKTTSVSRTDPISQQSHDAPATTKHYYAPVETRGTLSMSQKGYDRVHELLLRLDFSSLEAARASTKRWIAEASVTGGLADGIDAWGRSVVGKKKPDAQTSSEQQADDANGVTMLTTKKKRSNADHEAGDAKDRAPAESTPVSSATAGNENILGQSLLRKKPKPEASAASTTQQDHSQSNEVNTLGAGLVRKKAKT